jgi:hypothetical protein
MTEFTCAYCLSHDEMGGVWKCNGCKKEYCHECTCDAFIHNSRRNCIHCAKKRVYVDCSLCGKNIDAIDIKKKCWLCKRSLCEECATKEQHSVKKCLKN